MTMKIPTRTNLGNFGSRFLPDNARISLKLLSRQARVKFIVLFSCQIMLSLLEILALSIITLTLTISLNSYTRINDLREINLGLLNPYLTNFSAESRIGILLALYVTLMVFKTFFSALVIFATLQLLATQSAQIGHRLNKELYNNKAMSIRFSKSQENLNGVTSGIESLVVGYLGTGSQLGGDLATLVTISIAMLFFDFETSLTLIGVLLLLLLVLHRFVNLTAAKLSKQVATLSTELNRNTLDSWLVYRELLLAQKVNDFLDHTLGIRKKIVLRRARLSFLPSLNKYIFELFLILSALVVSALQLLINGISEAVSSFVLIAAASARLLPALLRFQSNLLAIKQSIGSSFYAKQVLELSKSSFSGVKTGVAGKPSNSNFIASLEIQDVFFSYPESGELALNGVSLIVAPGTFLAITGSSGSGKSTLVDVILGFLTPQSGRVQLSGVEPSVAMELWPGKIGYVPQDVQIIEGTILENIILTPSRGHNEERVKECVAESGLLDDLSVLPDGMNTKVGERGLRLSGGQKQRLGIARALYSNPKVLVFDEATSSLDPITERGIMRTIYQRLPDRTVIVVAHRLSTVISADVVVYMKAGTFVGKGTFEELRNAVPEFLEQADLSGL